MTEWLILKILCKKCKSHFSLLLERNKYIKSIFIFFINDGKKFRARKRTEVEKEDENNESKISS